MSVMAGGHARELADRLESAFAQVALPEFDKVLDPIMYSRADQEPVEILSALYPFENLEPDDSYYIDEILMHMRVEGWLFLIPKCLRLYLIGTFDWDDNLSSKLHDYLSDQGYSFPELDEKKSEFRDRMNSEQKRCIDQATVILGLVWGDDHRGEPH